MKTRTPALSPDSSDRSEPAPEESPGWRVPGGAALVEFAFRKGVVAGMLLRAEDKGGGEKDACREH